MKVATRCQTALVSQVVSKVYGNPELYDHILSLYGGPTFNNPSSYPPKVITAPNVSSPVSSPIDIDIGRLEAICAYSSIRPYSIHKKMCEVCRCAKIEDDDPMTIYLFASLFNHACTPNSSRIFFGDVMVVRACKNIAVGEEITVAYMKEDGYYARLSALQDIGIPACDCRLCEEDRVDGETACHRRDALRQVVSSIIGNISAEESRTILADVAVTYAPSRGVIRPDMAQAHFAASTSLRHIHSSNASFMASLIEAFNSLDCLGVKVVDRSTEGLVHDEVSLPISTDFLPSFSFHDEIALSLKLIALTFVRLQDFPRIVKWLRALSWSECLVHYIATPILICFVITPASEIITGDKGCFLLQHGTDLYKLGLLAVAKNLDNM